MSIAQAVEPSLGISARGTAPSGRIASIDAFRGLTILVMIFVNDVAGIKGAPWWMRHMPTSADGMTFVDLVFPAFLFIVGMSIPFAFKRRLERGDSGLKLWGHVLVRTLGLLLIGVFMVNMESGDWKSTGMSLHLWRLLLYVSVIVIWNQYGTQRLWVRVLAWIPRLAGFAVLAYLAYIYRDTPSDDRIIYMRPHWWGILGLIGWAYLVAATIYLIFRNQIAAMVGMVSFLLTLYIGDHGGAFRHAEFITKWVWIGGVLGSQASITTAGVAVSLLFFPNTLASTAGQRIRWILVFGIFMALAGFCLRPIYGISKDNATAPWCLISSALCCAIFVFMYWIMDVLNIRKWSVVLRPAGENPLLAYIMPGILYSVLGLCGVKILDQFSEGGIGIARSAVFALLVIGITAVLGRMRIRLKF